MTVAADGKGIPQGVIAKIPRRCGARHRAGRDEGKAEFGSQINLESSSGGSVLVAVIPTAFAPKKEDSAPVVEAWVCKPPQRHYPRKWFAPVLVRPPSTARQVADQRDEEKDQEYHEQDFRNTSCRNRYAGKAHNRGNQRDHEKHKRPI